MSQESPRRARQNRERSETISLRISAVARVHRQRAGALLHGLGLSAGQELLLMLLWEKEPRTQAEIEICRGLDRAETPHYLPQFRRLLVKLTARSAPVQVLSRSPAARFTKHQLIEPSTNHFAIVFSHNSFTYK